MSDLIVDRKKRVLLGEELRSKRIMLHLSIQDLSSLTHLEITHLKLLEEGKIENVSPLELIKLGEALETNYMFFYKTLGYIHNIAVIQYFVAEDNIYPLEDKSNRVVLESYN